MNPRRRPHRSVSALVAVAVCVGVAGGSHVLAASGDGDAAVADGAVAIADAGSLAGTELDVVQGEAAVEQLEQTGTLDEVAADAGFEPGELRDELLEDPAVFVTESGFVGYADTLEAPAAWTAERLEAAALPADVFALDSRPSSSRVLYLDFNGHVGDDPAWSQVGYSQLLRSAPFDLDGSANTFSATEQAVIYDAWQRVAEDYRPFDINVTTRDPGVDALRRTSTVDANYGQRMVITPTNFTTASVIGVALLDVFDASFDHAAYVFTDLAYKQTAKTVGEAVSHEAGHTFGLNHDGGSVSPNYYDGHGSWAPIMGRPLDPARPVTQWSRGEYAGANNFEDDLAEIAALAGYRPDDHGDTTGRSTVVPSSGVAGGVIERTGDRDVFAVDVLAGTLSVQLRPPAGEAAWSNLAASLTVRNGAGSVVASAVPNSPSSWTVNVGPAVTAGRYTIEVEPIGWLTASTGFTTYGSLGAYELALSAPQGQPPAAPDASSLTPITPTRLVDTRIGLGGSGRVDAGRQVVVQVAGRAGVPATATAAVVNVAAVGPSAAGFATVYPCSDRVPDTSTLNFVASQTVANTTIAALSNAGQLCVWVSTEAHVLVDITGWLGPTGSSRLTPLGPTRVVDTRTGFGGGRLVAGATLEVDLAGMAPAGSSAVAANVTAVNAAAPGFLTVFPCGGAVPNASTVNFGVGEARPNNTIVGLSGGRICIFSDADTDVLVDVVGSFGSEGLGYRPTSPVRVLDTRRTGTLAAAEAVGYNVGAAGLGARVPGAASVNVTAANHLAPGFVTTFDCVTRRDTSTLNQQVGQAAANGAIVPLDGLRSCAWTFGGGDLIVDLNGWWVP